MPVKNILNKIDLTQPRHLQTLVENRRIFNLENCELNVFESYQEAYRVPLTFHDFVITSMVRGKKVMHLFDKPSFEYLPG
ncbi:MAG: AraC family transcriptional regulator N-terminal domain-containing protein, partial [Chitinophagaceae bacterium]|nr:AraC family transcriptional regulator N-terminal domain-containing protein [Chitinophagaceae bacterium]